MIGKISGRTGGRLGGGVDSIARGRANEALASGFESATYVAGNLRVIRPSGATEDIPLNLPDGAKTHIVKRADENTDAPLPMEIASPQKNDVAFVCLTNDTVITFAYNGTAWERGYEQVSGQTITVINTEVTDVNALPDGVVIESY